MAHHLRGLVVHSNGGRIYNMFGDETLLVYKGPCVLQDVVGFGSVRHKLSSKVEVLRGGAA
jgi:hypothetical protein